MNMSFIVLLSALSAYRKLLQLYVNILRISKLTSLDREGFYLKEEEFYTFLKEVVNWVSYLHQVLFLFVWNCRILFLSFINLLAAKKIPKEDIGAPAKVSQEIKRNNSKVNIRSSI